MESINKKALSERDICTKYITPAIPSTNDDAFLEHDRTIQAGTIERELPLHTFPAPGNLWRRYCAWGGDIAGRHIIRISNDATDRQSLVSRLKTAGCALETQDKTDWLNEGEFDNILKAHLEFIEKEILDYRRMK